MNSTKETILDKEQALIYYFRVNIFKSAFFSAFILLLAIGLTSKLSDSDKWSWWGVFIIPMMSFCFAIVTMFIGDLMNGNYDYDSDIFIKFLKKKVQINELFNPEENTKTENMETKELQEIVKQVYQFVNDNGLKICEHVEISQKFKFSDIDGFVEKESSYYHYFISCSCAKQIQIEEEGSPAYCDIYGFDISGFGSCDFDEALADFKDRFLKALSKRTYKKLSN